MSYDLILDFFGKTKMVTCTYTTSVKKICAYFRLFFRYVFPKDILRKSPKTKERGGGTDIRRPPPKKKG